jgi:hypothetical protein
LTETVIDTLAVECLLHDDYPEALTRFNELIRGKDETTKHARLARAHVIRGEADGARKVRELVTPLLQDPSPFIRRRALAALCLACPKDDIEAYARTAHSSISDDMYAVDDLWKGEACVRYYAGLISADELLAQAGDHRFALSNFHCTIAMKCLAERDRAGALQHFQAAVDTETFQSADFELARAYLTRMKADARWPYWLDDTQAE